MTRFLTFLIVVVGLQYHPIQLNAQGIIQTVAGNGIAGYSGDNGPATDAQVANPGSTFVDASGNIFIADYSNNVVRKVDNSTGVITTVAGNGAAGYSGDGGPATNASFNGVAGVYLDLLGNIYVADVFNRVIRKVTVATGTITTVAGNGISGYTGDGGPATSASISVPSGIFIDKFGNIFIAEYGNHVIRKVAASSGIISTIAGSGTSGFSGDGSLATNAKLYQPNGVYVDTNNNVYIADTRNQRIRKVSASTGIITTIAGIGTSGYSGDGSLATTAQFFNPVAVFADTSLNIFVADASNNVIRKISTSGIISTIAGNNTAGYSGDGDPATSAQIKAPSGIFWHKSKGVFITDAGNNCIRNVTASTTGINISNALDGLKIYPNPCKDYFIAENLGVNDLLIYNLAGKLIGISNVRHSANVQQFDLSNLSTGYYIIKVLNKTSSDISESYIIKKE